MKVVFSVCLLLVILNISAFAQEKILTESEFNAILERTESKLKTQNYRLTKTEELFLKPNEKAENVRIEIKEVVLPNKWREVIEERSKDKTSKTERLWDGSKLYKRENDGEWKKFDGGGGMGMSIRSGKFTKVFKFVEKIVLDGKNVNLYEVQITRVANKFTQTSSYQVTYVEKSKYWIGEDDLLLKKKVENTIQGLEAVAVENWVYEYDPKNLKIEAPIK